MVAFTPLGNKNGEFSTLENQVTFLARREERAYIYVLGVIFWWQSSKSSIYYNLEAEFIDKVF